MESELRELMEAILARHESGVHRERTVLAGRLRVLIGDDRPDLSAIDQSENFGQRARQLVARLRPEGLASLLAHLLSASPSRPSGVCAEARHRAR